MQAIMIALVIGSLVIGYWYVTATEMPDSFNNESPED